VVGSKQVEDNPASPQLGHLASQHLVPPRLEDDEYGVTCLEVFSNTYIKQLFSSLLGRYPVQGLLKPVAVVGMLKYFHVPV
jgi:hypothetical protein